MSQIKRTGYGQVEPNHLSAQRTAQIYAQLPANSDIKILENGQFVKYDYANNEVNLTGAGEWMLVFNEIKLYDDRKQTYSDFAMLASDSVDGVIVPRVFKTNIGDIYTTNMIKEEDIVAGDKLTPGEDGILAKTTEDADMLWQVAKIYTLADGQAAVKIQRIK
jgi:hypothetical protein